MDNNIWHILLVEDDEDDYFLTRKLLTEARRGRFRIDWRQTFQDGEAALAACTDSTAYDVIIVDYDLGKHTGIELVRNVNRAGLRIPVILLTGRGSFEVDVEAMQAGASDYLNKGEINPTFLERSIRYAIDRFRSEEALTQANQALASVNLALATANTALERANQLAQQERARLDAIIENAPSGIVLTDQSGNFVLTNPATQLLFSGGVTGTASGPSGKYTLHHPNGEIFREAELPLIQTMATGEAQQNVEMLIRHETGRESFVLVNTSPIRDTEGKVSGAVAVLSDITDRKKIEAEREHLLEENLLHQASLEQQRSLLISQNEILEQIIEYAPLGIALLQGDDHHYTLANPAHRVIARGKGELIMRPITEVWPEVSSTLAAIIERVSRTGMPATFQDHLFIVNRDQGEEEAYFTFTVSPQFDDRGQVSGIMLLMLETTDQVRAMEYETQMEVQHQLLQQREMERQQIARDIHDGPIQRLISLIFPVQTAMAISDDRAVKEMLSDLRDELQRLTSELRGVCNELRPPVLARFGLKKAIQANAEALHEKFPDIEIVLDLSEDGDLLPESTRLALFRIYQESMNNILRHAKATRVAVRMVMDETAVTLEIDDNGGGFAVPVDWLEFSRQGHLGLVGMRERAQAAGGELSISSQPGRGTRLQVCLPRQA